MNTASLDLPSNVKAIAVNGINRDEGANDYEVEAMDKFFASPNPEIKRYNKDGKVAGEKLNLNQAIRAKKNQKS